MLKLRSQTKRLLRGDSDELTYSADKEAKTLDEENAFSGIVAYWVGRFPPNF